MTRPPQFRSAFALAIAVLVATRVANAAPRAEPWPRFERYDAGSTQVIDHDAWEALLQRYVRTSPDGIHRFDYRAVTADDRERLRRYIARASELPISRYSRPEQKAFWINLYNAQTVEVVLDHYPVDSIRDIDLSPGWFSVGPWKKKLRSVEGTGLSLDDIEHRILRPGWRDPRIHYALNCASLGCPNLQPRAFRAGDLDGRLEAAAREYVNHPRGVARDGDGWRVSTLYKWFQDDFGGTETEVLQHLIRYAGPALAAALRRGGPIESYHYDWALNGTADRP